MWSTLAVSRRSAPAGLKRQGRRHDRHDDEHGGTNVQWRGRGSVPNLCNNGRQQSHDAIATHGYPIACRPMGGREHLGRVCVERTIVDIDTDR